MNISISHTSIRRAFFCALASLVSFAAHVESQETVKPVRPAPTVVPAGKGQLVKARGGIRQGAWQSLSESDGLIHDRIRAMLQTEDGVIWIGTDNGLSRFDGGSFTHFTTSDGLLHKTVRAIYKDKKGLIWIGTNGGVSRYDGKTFTNFTKQDGLPDDRVWKIMEDRQGLMWFTTLGAGVSCYDGTTFTNFNRENGLVNNLVPAIYEDKKGQMWFGTWGGVSRYDGTSFTHFTRNDGLAHNRVPAIYEDSKGQMWFGTIGGVSRYDGTSFTNFTRNDGLANNRVPAIYEDKKGQMWFGTWGGVSRYDGQTFTNFTKQNGLTDNRISDIIEDDDGNLWFGTQDGISRYDREGLKTFKIQDGLIANSITTCFEDKNGILWFGGQTRGVSRFDGTTFTNFTTSDGLINTGLRAIHQDRNGHLWFGTDRGVSRFDGTTFTNFTTSDGLVNNRIYAISQDQNGHLWFGTNRGVSRFDGTTFTNFTTLADRPNRAVWALCEDSKGRMWFATRGVSYYDGQTFTNLTTEDGLVGDAVRALCEDRHGRMWIGTQGGLSVYDGETFTNFTTDDGLPHNRVQTIIEDKEGILWIGTDEGLCRYDGTVFQTLRRRDGLDVNSILSLVQDQSGDIWIGTSAGGVSRYRIRSVPPSVALLNVRTNESHGVVNEIRLPVTQPSLEIDFYGASFRTRPETMLYRYRLVGHTSQWQVTPSSQVEYRDLPVGEYTFEVEAIDQDLAYSEEPLRVSVQVHWPYGDLFLYGILGCAMLGLIWQASQIVQRNRTLRRSNAELAIAKEVAETAREAADTANQAKSIFLANMSHEIRTPMNAIIGYAQILDGDQQLNADQRQAVETIGKSGHHLLGLINDVLDISKIEAGREELNPADFDLASTIDAIGRMFEIRCTQKHLDWHLDTNITNSAVHGDEGKIRQVLINMLGNAVKFTEEGSVTLKVTQSNNHTTDTTNQNKDPTTEFLFEVTDTGPGIAPDKQAAIFEPFQQDEAGHKMGGTGLGLSISKRHVELMNGDMSLTSELDKGSTFSITLPLPPAQGSVEDPDQRDWRQVKKLADGHSVDALIVDDRQANRDVLAGLLSRIGVTVRTVDNGEDALQLMREKMPNIVFLDIRMPVIDGPETLKRILAEFGDDATRVIAVTASVFDHQRKRYLDLGFEELINKPIQAGEIYTALEKHLQVTFDQPDQPAPESAPETEDMDWSSITIPADLHDNLMEATQVHSITQLRAHIETLAQQGGPDALIARLRTLAAQFDIEGAKDLIQQIKGG